MNSLLVALVIALLSLGVAACGSQDKSRGSVSEASSSAAANMAITPSATVLSGGYVRGDDDADGSGSEDYDDAGVRGYGRAASAADRQVVTALLKGYYAAAAAGDGATACSLMLPRLVKGSNLGEAAEEAYPPAPSTPPLRGKSCAQIMSLLFTEDHQQLAADSATLVVSSLRVKGNHGLALLGFRTTPERQIPVERGGGVWKVDAPLDSEVP
jgi:hypothetical protein